MEVVVRALDPRYRKLESRVRRSARKALRHLKKQSASVEIYLVNRRFMDKNVLAFETPKRFPKLRGESPPLGEIYLNPAYIKRHSEDLTFMLIHGILHLIGYDHKARNDRMKMEKKEQELLIKLQ